MPERRRLSTTKMTIQDEIANDVLHHYRLDLSDGSILAVRMPGRLSPSNAAEIVDQLRDLAFAISSSAGLPEQEVLAREALSRSCDELRQASEDVPDLDSALTLLALYACFREAVAEFIRYAGQ